MEWAWCSGQEEFCFPVECLSLTVEEVMHIRQVLVKAELEKFQQFKDIYNALKKGKVQPFRNNPPISTQERSKTHTGSKAMKPQIECIRE